MSAFRITGSRRLDEKDVVEFVVEARSGSPLAGEEFRCWDTHHPADYVILEVQKKDACYVIKCRGWLGFDGLFEEAVIDTDYKVRGSGSHYERAAKKV
jgi:hypothetical protein